MAHTSEHWLFKSTEVDSQRMCTHACTGSQLPVTLHLNGKRSVCTNGTGPTSNQYLGNVNHTRTFFISEMCSKPSSCGNWSTFYLEFAMFMCWRGWDT